MFTDRLEGPQCEQTHPVAPEAAVLALSGRSGATADATRQPQALQTG